MAACAILKKSWRGRWMHCMVDGRLIVADCSRERRENMEYEGKIIF